MKKLLLLLAALIAGASAWAESYITDVMLIGGTQDETNALKTSYTAQGWTVIDQNLNAGCKSSSDRIYLLYKEADDDTDNVSFITDFLITGYSVYDTFDYNGRTYNLAPYDGGSHFTQVKGNLNSNAGGSEIYLYYTKQNDDECRTVREISFNDNPNGAVCYRGSSGGYDLNNNCSTSTKIYMHAEKSQGWAIAKKGTGAECNIISFDGPAANIPYLKIPVSIDGATVTGFASYFNFGWFKRMRTIEFGEGCQLTQMPVMEGCSRLSNVSTGGTVGKIPPSMTRIPSNAFAGTNLYSLNLTPETEIDDYAFSYIRAKCSINYSGSISDWNPLKYAFSIISINAQDGSCGWCGGENAESNNFLYWTLDTDGNLNIDCYDYFDFDCWEAYPAAQGINGDNFNINDIKDKVKHVTLQHVYKIENAFFGFNDYWEDTMRDFTKIETVEAKSGLVSIGWNVFAYSPKLRKVTLPSTVTNIGKAFHHSTQLKDIYFYGTKAQWDNAIKAEDWSNGISNDFLLHCRCTVTFDNMGFGTAPEPQIMWGNEDLVTLPPVPSSLGSVFTGWYTDASCSTRWDFASKVTDNMTLYAGWKAKYAPIEMSAGGVRFTMIKVAGNANIDTFYIGKCEVTEELWLAVMGGKNPSSYCGDLKHNLPVENITWNDCQAFITKLNQRTGYTFRLPTIDEWLFAAGGGIYAHGYTYSGSNAIDDVAWYAGNCSQKQTVGTKAANELGLNDMSGNVYEFVQEATGAYGGGWHSPGNHCKANYRWGADPTFKDNDTGFRLALTNLDVNPALLRGDLNGDGMVDVTDVSMLIDVVLGKHVELAARANPDLNNDGVTDVTDVSLLIDIVLGK